MKKINIGILGCGTVGTGVAKMLTEKKDLITSRVGAYLHLKQIADIDLALERDLKLDPGILIDDAGKIINDPEIDIIIETIGGEDIAKELILKAIDNGKHVVTANKALLANHGNAIFKAASVKGIDIAFEASVGGSIPIIKSLRESLAGNQIYSMAGILNGTCNYILSKISSDGIEFKDALGQAQAKGFAEADPTLDINGFDTAHKLAILTALAYGIEINLNDIYVEGISKITPLDIEFAREFGYSIKLLAISKNNGDSIEARIHPTMILFDNILSSVNGSLNAVTISGDAAGDVLLYGHGAGMMPTASAIISDIIDIARNLMAGIQRRIPPLSYQTGNIKKIPVLPIDEINTHYYFRFSAADQPGVLSKISGILGSYGISIKSVHQKGRKSKGPVPIVMLTHNAKEANMKKALSEISSLDFISDMPVIIRIEEEDKNDE